VIKIAFVCLDGIDRCPRALRLRRYMSGVARDQDLHIEVVSVQKDAVNDFVLGAPKRLVRRLLNAALLTFRLFSVYLSQRYRLEPKLASYDAVVCFDLLLLPAATRQLKSDSRTFDVREYYPAQFEDRFDWRVLVSPLVDYIVRGYMSEYKLITVSEGVAKLYRDSYSLNTEVMPSYADYHDLQPTECGEIIRVVHHGVANPNRRIEYLIRAMDYAPNSELHLYLVRKEQGYFSALEREAELRTNVILHDPVDFHNLVPELSQYDVGIFAPPGATLNLIHSLPNKVFEYIQARLMVVVSKLPDIRRLVESLGIGESVEHDPASIGKYLSALHPEKVNAAKRKANAAAQDLHSDAWGRRYLQATGLDDILGFEHHAKK